MTDAPSRAIRRRELLAGIAGGATSTLAGCGFFERNADNQAAAIDSERARSLAERFAPTIYFDEFEQWFPTDPRPYTSEEDGEVIVDGSDALDGYTDRYTDPESPPDPTVFYNAVEYDESPLAVIQFWMYSAFDQFTTNFHWHDWEVLHVFIDTEFDEPVLYVASSHSRKVPNNEFLNPTSEHQPRILSELGSHSSALSVNEERDRFQRFPVDDMFADITNSAIEGLEDLAELPLAYGLPRDEGMRLPFVIPELDGVPVYDHPDLPSVHEEDLISGAVTVRSLAALTAPPTDLPERATDLVFGYAGHSTEDATVEYSLVETAELEDIADFTGPQLSFEFSIPEFAEDAIASHITTTGVPWDDPRYENPARDISDPNHRAALADRYAAIGEPAPANMILTAVSQAVSEDAAPEDEGITTEEPTVEAFAFIESEPAAIPTFQGVAVAQDVPAGEHRFSVNGAGVAPHSEAVSVTEDPEPTIAGVDGEIPLVAREAATKLEVDTRSVEAELTRVAVEDDFGGRIFETPVAGPEAVYVHQGGAYTTEVRDVDDEIGAFRVNPSDTASVRIEEPRTGKASLAGFLAAIAGETQESVAAVAADTDGSDSGGRPSGNDGPSNAVRGLARALQAVVEAAENAQARAEAGERGRADSALEAVATRLQQVADRLADARGDLPAPLARATERRLDQAQLRSNQAKRAKKL